jgi:predicted branched-subunit amino acid permease
MGMSLIVFGATAQLGTLPLIVAGAPLWLIVATALVVNLRFLIFSAAMARPLAGGRPGLRWLCGYLLTDGVFATMLERLRTEPDPAWRLGAYLAPSVWCALVWQTSTLVGVLAAGSIPRNWSLEFMASIALLVLMVPMARVRPMLVSAATGGVLAVLLRGMPLERASLPDVVQRALRYAPAAALAAIVVPDVVLVSGAVEVFNPKLGAAIAAVLAARASRNPWLPFVAGMAVLWGLRWGAG